MILLRFLLDKQGGGDLGIHLAERPLGHGFAPGCGLDEPLGRLEAAGRIGAIHADQVPEIVAKLEAMK